MTVGEGVFVVGLRRAAGLRPPLRQVSPQRVSSPAEGDESEYERRSRATPGERIVDSRTGVEFYSMIRIPADEAARLGRSGEKGVMSLPELLAMKRNSEDDGFRGLSGDDLVESAKRFLAPARVQLSEREIRELQRERAKMEREASVEYERDQAELDVEIEKLGPSSEYKEYYENPSNGV